MQLDKKFKLKSSSRSMLDKIMNKYSVYFKATKQKIRFLISALFLSLIRNFEIRSARKIFSKQWTHCNKISVKKRLKQIENFISLQPKNKPNIVLRKLKCRDHLIKESTCQLNLLFRLKSQFSEALVLVPQQI